ncbi:hypothetical protein [Rhodoplanes roseus]|uniref:Uncharacterized protein n=1 Tax=Rhodoplanes roseus TaxID=29409 RepID=A0A327KX26_9BRAD|nr:hypothetical protein [Rhodoplanes roseus]RAI42223.1 hypothetical protein CH341_20115 [Rhodoplanes roseus]
MKRLFTLSVGAAVALTLAGAPALAQIATPSLDIGGSTKKLTSEEVERQKAIDEAYRRTVKEIPDKPTTVDPWGTVRQAPSSGTAAKPQAPRQAAKPDAVKPGAVKPDAVKPDAVKPAAPKPTAAKPVPATPVASSRPGQ